MPADDPVVQAAKISRRGTIVGALIAASALVAVWVLGTVTGERATLTSPRTFGDERPSGAASSPGDVRLFDSRPVEGEFDVEPGKATVDGTEYPRSLTFASDCHGGRYATVSYDITSGAKGFHAAVGIADGGPDNSAVFAVSVDGDVKERVHVTARETVELNAHLRHGSRLEVRVEVEKARCDATTTAVLIDPALS